MAECDTTTVFPATARKPVVRPAAVIAQGNCNPYCEQVFANVKVVPKINGGTLVQWDLHPDFSETTPHTFQLQVSKSGDTNADDWEAVGATAADVSWMEDDEKRLYGKYRNLAYRICVSTAAGNTYLSPPVLAVGDLGFKDRRRFVEMLRAQSLMLQRQTGVEGYLLKKRIAGTLCAECTDYVTKEVVKPDCATCEGTGIVGGYFDPVPCFYAALDQEQHRTHIDPSRGTVDDLPRVRARMLASPILVFSRDVWVDKKSDDRWMIHEISHAAELRGVPIVLDVGLRLLPYSDAAYAVEVG